MVAMRGNPNDYNKWANDTGDERWSYENLLPFFKKLENYRGDFPVGKIISALHNVQLTKLGVPPKNHSR